MEHGGHFLQHGDTQQHRPMVEPRAIYLKVDTLVVWGWRGKRLQKVEMGKWDVEFLSGVSSNFTMLMGEVAGILSGVFFNVGVMILKRMEGGRVLPAVVSGGGDGWPFHR